MILVDTVYQKVLALANKEQRGYITPQDFNLFASQAQLEIFEQYFYDVNGARRVQGNDTVYADIDDMLEEKMQVFETTDEQAVIGTYAAAPGNGLFLPNNFYRVHRIETEDANRARVACEILNTKDFRDCMSSGPLVAPSDIRPITNIRNNTIRCIGSDNLPLIPASIIYFRIPARVNWTYVVINKQAMYNAGTTTGNFELHPSEENQLVNKILRLAGISNEQQEVMRAGHEMDMTTIKQQPKTQ
jgi:hypothetical protein